MLSGDGKTGRRDLGGMLGKPLSEREPRGSSQVPVEAKAGQSLTASLSEKFWHTRYELRLLEQSARPRLSYSS